MKEVEVQRERRKREKRRETRKGAKVKLKDQIKRAALAKRKGEETRSKRQWREGVNWMES